MELLQNKRIIVGSVAFGSYTNLGNLLIEKSTFNLLGLPPDTPRFSVFQKISDELLEYINSHEYVLITGCTTLQDDPGHQICFDDQFKKIKIKKVCLAGSFYCEPCDSPSIRIARMYDLPIGVRDPWSAEYLTKSGIDCSFIGCPTLIEGKEVISWKEDNEGSVLISSSPVLEADHTELLRNKIITYIKHDSSSEGEELDYNLFNDASLVITGRLHAALPAIARGIKVKFYDQRYWHQDYKAHYWGSIRYSLLEYLGINLHGEDNLVYPESQIKLLKLSFNNWIEKIINQ